MLEGIRHRQEEEPRQDYPISDDWGIATTTGLGSAHGCSQCDAYDDGDLAFCGGE